MTTPTGFLFNNNGNIVDLSDVFQPKTSGVSITTNFISTANSGQDLGALFQAGSSGLTTGYISTTNSNQDLGSLFAPIIYTVTVNSNYTQSINGNTYTLTFNPNTFKLTFNVDVSNVTFIIVGGGGGARSNGYFDSSLRNIISGVGGGGAASLKVNFPNGITATSAYNLTVGQGGAGGAARQIPPPDGIPGGESTVFIAGAHPVLDCRVPGGKASTGILSNNNGSNTVYYLPAVNDSDPPNIINISTPNSVEEYKGGGCAGGAGVYSVTGTSRTFPGGGGGGNGTNFIPLTSPNTISYGGGGGTSVITLPTDTSYGSVVSLNGIGGVKGSTQGDIDATLLPGNQTFQGSRIIGIPGPGSGGSGAGLIWQANSDSAFFGLGGNGGDGVIIVEFTYP